MHTLETHGLFCQEPVMLTQQQLRKMQAGESLQLVATDPATLRDIPKLCRFLGHVLVSQEEADGEYRFVIEKSA